MRISLRGVGLWARGLASYDDVERAARNGSVHLAGAFTPPRPSAIPPRERRRAGLLINLAVEVAHQACDHANVGKSRVASVFASSMGDTAVTDYMCRKLAQRDRLLSPARFTNSVHNAAAGYWAISVRNHAPSTFVSGFDASFGIGLLETASQATASGEPVLLVAYDIANEAPLDDVRRIPETLGVALVVDAVAADDADDAADAADNGGLLDADIRFVAEAAEPPVPLTKGLDALARGNPIGAALALVERCTGHRHGGDTLRIPAAAQGCVELRFPRSAA